MLKFRTFQINDDFKEQLEKIFIEGLTEPQGCKNKSSINLFQRIE
jgi:hypothetical protein